MLHVDMQGGNKWFGDLHVLRDITLAVSRGERIVICGPSGSGKSTLIRCINGLEPYQSGRVAVEGIELTGDGTRIDEVNEPDAFFDAPQHARTQAFLSRVLR